MRYTSIIILLFLISAASCSSGAEKERRILTSLLGREIAIPESLSCRIQDTPIEYSSIDYSMRNADYKIITYVDSSGCKSCHMKLQSWDRYINSLMVYDDIDVAFLMILNGNNVDEIDGILTQSHFNHLVTLDIGNSFLNANPLPHKSAYQTLLLNVDNRIVAVGNPAVNPKVREVYNLIINGKSGNGKHNFCLEPVEAVGVLYLGDTIIRRFALNNSTKTPLTIQEIVPSCNCVEATVSSNAILPGVTEFVTVTLVADSVVGPFKRHVDVFYNEKDDPERITLHGFVTNNPINQPKIL